MSLDKSKYYKSLYFVKELKYQIVLITIGYLFVGFLEALATSSYYPVISHLLKISNQTMDNGFFLKMIFKLSSFIRTEDALIRSCILAIGLTCTSLVFNFIVDAVSLWLKYSLSSDSLLHTYNLLLRQKKLDEKNTSGEMVYMITNSSSSVGEIFHYLPKTLVEVAKIVFLGLVLVELSFVMTLVLGFIMLATFMLYHLWGVKVIYVLSEKLRKVEANSLSFLNQSVNGHTTIRGFNGLSFFAKKYQIITEQLKRYSFHSQFLNNIPNKAALLLFQSSAFFIIIYLKSKDTQAFESMLPAMATYFISLQKILPAVSNLGANWLGVQNLIPRMEVLYDYCFGTLFDDEIIKIGPPIEVDSIDFKNVTYDIGDKRILSDINLSINKGEFVALVGASGSGKSTLAKLLTNTVFPTKGKITVNGVELADIHQSVLNETFSIVEQSPFLFSMSVQDNIKMGNEAISHEKMIKASEMSGVLDFIGENRFSEEIKEGGANLSGGQKQKISIARSIARSPRVLILDEATSAFDAISEQKFKNNLSLLRKDFTLIVIAHRLSSIVDADKIYVLDHGVVKEVGNHQELLAHNGIYKNMYNSFYEK